MDLAYFLKLLGGESTVLIHYSYISGGLLCALYRLFMVISLPGKNLALGTNAGKPGGYCRHAKISMPPDLPAWYNIWHTGAFKSISFEWVSDRWTNQ